MSDFLIYGDVEVCAARESDVFFLNKVSEAEKNAHRELVVKESALYVSAFRYLCSGVKRHDITDFYSESLYIVIGVYVFVKHDFGGVPAALCVSVAAVDVYGSIAELESAFVNLAVPCVNSDVFGFRVLRSHAAEICQLQSAGAFSLRYHAAESVCVSFKQERVAVVFPAEVNEHSSLCGYLRVKAECGKLILHPFGSLVGKSRRAVYRKELYRFFCRIFSVFSVHNICLSYF